MQWNRYAGRFGVCVIAMTAAAMSVGSLGSVQADSLAKTSGLAGASLVMDSIVGDSNKIITAAADTKIEESLPELLETVSIVAVEETGAEEEAEEVLATEAAGAAEEEAVPEVTEEEAVEEETIAENADAEEVTVEEEETAETDAEPVAEEEEAAEEEAEEEPAVSKYENVGISIASNYVNIRTEPSTDSEIVAKLYKGCKCDILEQAGEWVKISSGNATGYIKEEFLARGFDAEALIDTYGRKYVEVETETLRVREEPSVDSKIATLVPQTQMLLTTDEKDGWYEVSIDDGEITGWVSSEFVSVHYRFKHAITIEEEEAEARRQREAEEALAAQQRALAARTNATPAPTQNNNSGSTQKSSNSSNYNTYSTGSGTGAQIAAFAQRFVGNPYVYGGTSLTNGADCSGFVQSVYANFGYSLPRTSAAQCAGAGYQVSLSNLKPGDLIFYAYGGGRVSHVAMYIGNGRVVHASDPSVGIITQTMDYRSIYMAKRIVD